ncbi:hypothetical protein JB92DRAFT_2975132 [Gautieria morchelliformis]|nr:hypothetical protein JB92DRAFT_2975132 [Gautieria morchelliformis]
MASPARAPVRRSTSSVPAAPTSPPRPKATSNGSIISKGATARSAVSPRAGPSPNGRTKTPTTSAVSGPSPRSSPIPSGELHANGRDALVASLKRETDEKEELLVRLQEKETQLKELTTENATVTSTLHAAESRLAELYADQSRMEEDVATRMEIAEKLRSQVRDLEREKREALRRYTEQTATFEAERQALYDNEQHLKSRIQSLTAARKVLQEAAERPVSPAPSIAHSIAPSEAQPTSPATPVAHPTRNDDVEVSDGPEITALKLELSTLSTSHTSLQTMVQMLQTELADLKRVNNELQEENESYGLLLMERAMNGTGVEMLREMGGDASSTRSGSYGDERSLTDEAERSSLRSGGRSVLDRVSEDEEFVPEGDHPSQIEPNSLALELQAGQGLEPPSSSRRRRTRQNSAASSLHGTPVGESLADLPITGPGLDLAAELGRAETKDIFDGHGSSMGTDHSPSKSRSSRKNIDGVMGPGKDAPEEVTALRQEVKSLKDANKALSLYASKIIDRIIMQEGFEHVLAVDYDPDKVSPIPKSPGAFDEVLAKAKAPPTQPKARPQTMLLSRSSSAVTSGNPAPNFFRFPTSGEPEKLTTFSNSPPSPEPDVKRNRRSLSLADWKPFGMFGGGTPPDRGKNLRPLTLRPGAGSALAGARKLESQEDEEDRRERERLNATMKLMGIEKPSHESPAPLMLKTQSDPPDVSATEETRPVSNNRFSFFRSKPLTSIASEALEQAEAETTLASLDAREKELTAEIAKGGSGGFTELNAEGRMSLGDQWRSRRTRSVSGKSHGSSGASTVWSAGMKGDDE